MKIINIAITQDEVKTHTYEKDLIQSSHFCLINFKKHSRNSFLDFVKCIIIITLLEEVR